MDVYEAVVRERIARMSLGRLRVVTAGESHGPQLTILVENLPAGMPAAGRGRQRRPGAAPERLRPRGPAADRARLRRDRGRACGTGGRWAARSPWSSRTAIGRTGRAGWTSRRCPSRPRPSPACGPATPTWRAWSSTGSTTCATCSSAPARARRPRASRRAAWPRCFCVSSGSRFAATCAVDRHRSQADAPEQLALARDGASHAWWQAVEESPIRTGDAAFEEAAIELIKAARTAGDTLGGVFEVIAYGVPIGLGTYGQWDERLDGRLAAAIMSIQSIKGVEIGDAFANAARFGSQAHDVIDYDAAAGGWSRPTNHAGGLEGGVTNGMPLVVRGAAKPISTLINPLPSIDYATRERDVGARRAQRRVRAAGGGRGRRGDGRDRAGRRDAREVWRRQPRRSARQLPLVPWRASG